MLKKNLLIICFIFFSITNIYAQKNLQLNQNNKIRKSAQYQNALRTFKSGDFEKSLKLFGELSTKYIGDEYIEFYYGRSAFEVKKYELAYSAFDRVLIANESNHRARLELARTLFLMKAYKQSKKEFSRVLLAPIPKTVRTQIDKFIKMIEDKESGYILNKVAIFGIGWSDNIENTANDYLFNNQLQSQNIQEDFSFKAVVVGNLIAPFKKDNKKAWESTAVLFLQEQDTVKKNNIFVTSLSTGISYIEKGFKSTTSFTYDHIWIDNKHNMTFIGLAYNLKGKTNKTNMISLDIKLKDKNMYKNIDKAKDSRIIEFGLSYTMPIHKDILVLSANHSSETKDGGTRVDITKDINKLKVSYDKKIFDNYKTIFNYQYQQDTYNQMRSLAGLTTGEKREDIIHSCTLKVSKKLSKKKIIDLELIHIKNDTNHDAYAYKKQSVSLNYTIIF